VKTVQVAEVDRHEGEGLAFFRAEDGPAEGHIEASEEVEEDRVATHLDKSTEQVGRSWNAPSVAFKNSALHQAQQDGGDEEARLLRAKRREMEERLKMQGKMPQNRGNFKGD
jgi:hypothetical protein